MRSVRHERVAPEIECVVASHVTTAGHGESIRDVNTARKDRTIGSQTTIISR